MRGGLLPEAHLAGQEQSGGAAVAAGGVASPTYPVDTGSVVGRYQCHRSRWRLTIIYVARFARHAGFAGWRPCRRRGGGRSIASAASDGGAADGADADGSRAGSPRGCQRHRTGCAGGGPSAVEAVSEESGAAISFVAAADGEGSADRRPSPASDGGAAEPRPRAAPGSALAGKSINARIWRCNFAMMS